MDCPSWNMLSRKSVVSVEDPPDRTRRPRLRHLAIRSAMSVTSPIGRFQHASHSQKHDAPLYPAGIVDNRRNGWEVLTVQLRFDIITIVLF